MLAPVLNLHQMGAAGITMCFFSQPFWFCLARVIYAPTYYPASGLYIARSTTTRRSAQIVTMHIYTEQSHSHTKASASYT